MFVLPPVYISKSYTTPSLSAGDCSSYFHMISETEVSSSNPGRRNLLKKIKINYSLLLPTFAPKRELHMTGSIEP
jgi:hypothetical protein